MNSIIKVVLVFFTLFFMVGCAQKVQIKALTPAKVSQMAYNKKVAISNFKNDSVGLSDKLESYMASYEIDKKKYFTVLSRRDIDKILKEQRFQSSDLIDQKTTARVGKMVGAEAIINGKITTASADEGVYALRKKRCVKYDKDKKECAKYEYYIVKCKTTKATLGANINILNVQSSLVIHGDSYLKSYEADSCKNYSKVLGSNEALEYLSKQIAYEFSSKLTPKYIYFEVKLLDEIELDSTSKQDQKLENALKYIEANRIDKAQELLSELLDEFDGRSYVVAYNLGVVKEASAKLNEAKNLYSLADEITQEPVDELNEALIRIDQMISKRDEALRQIDAK